MTNSNLLTFDKLKSWLWECADILRSNVDSGDFKNYILSLLFLKRINDVFFYEVEILLNKGYTEEEAIKSKEHHSFKLPESAYWKTLTNTKTNIGKAIDNALKDIEADNPPLQDVLTVVRFDNEALLGNNTLKRLLSHFSIYSLANKDLYKPDVLGDAYEYLIERFAFDSGKKGGEFYTPRGVVKLLVRLLKPQPSDTIYDPCCGSGGMLIGSANYIKNHNPGHEYDFSLYGQEKSLSTWAICNINMFLHHYNRADIKKGDVLANPLHLKNDGKLMKFDRVIANPPFSLSQWWETLEAEKHNKGNKSRKVPSYRNNVSDPFNRFVYGIPSRKFGDLAFLQHMIATLKDDGRMGIVLPHGILYRRGAEEGIRKNIIEQDFIEGIVGLPDKLFYNTNISAVIIILNKDKSEKLQDKIIFLDASKEYKEEKTKNIIDANHIYKIADAYENLNYDEEFVRIVDKKEIRENNYNLNISIYLDVYEEQEPVDIKEVLTEIKKIETKEEEVDRKLSEYLKELGYKYE